MSRVQSAGALLFQGKAELPSQGLRVEISVIGGGLAGSEAAYQIARMGENPYVNGPYGMPLAKQLAGIKGQAVRSVSNAPRFGTTIWRFRPVKPVY